MKSSIPNIWRVKSSIPSIQDPFSLHNIPTDSQKMQSSLLHIALTYLGRKNTYAKMLFLDLSSAFNTIILQYLTKKLNLLGFNTPFCNLTFWQADHWLLMLATKPQTSSDWAPAPRRALCVALYYGDHQLLCQVQLGLISQNDKSVYKMRWNSWWPGATWITWLSILPKPKKWCWTLYTGIHMTNNTIKGLQYSPTKRPEPLS